MKPVSGTAHAIAEEILTAQMTEADIEHIAAAVRNRRQAINSTKTVGLMPGDRFTIGGNAPRYEHGGELIVKWVNEKTVTCEPHSPAFQGTRWARSRHVRVPITWVGARI